MVSFLHAATPRRWTGEPQLSTSRTRRLHKLQSEEVVNKWEETGDRGEWMNRKEELSAWRGAGVKPWRKTQGVDNSEKERGSGINNGRVH